MWPPVWVVPSWVGRGAPAADTPPRPPTAAATFAGLWRAKRRRRRGRRGSHQRVILTIVHAACRVAAATTAAGRLPPSGDSPATTATNATATASTAADAATTRRGTPPTVGGPARRPAAANAGAATKAAACAGAAPHRVCPSSRAGGGRTRAVRVGTWRHGGTFGGDRCCHLRRRWQGEAYVQALALDPLAPLKRHIKDLGLFLGGHAQRLAQKGNLRVNLEPRVLGVHVVPRPRRELDNPF